MIINGFQKFSLCDYPEKLSAIVFTQGCNFRCPYCHNPELLTFSDKSMYSQEEILDFLKSRQGKLDSVVITGGEPTFQKGLLNFIKKIKELDFLVKLDTNGSNPEVVKVLIEQNLIDYIAMDIKAPLEKYKFISPNVNTNDIQQSINIIMDSGIDYEFRTTVVRTLLEKDDFIEIGKLIKGAKMYALQKYVETKVLNPHLLKNAEYNDCEMEVFKNMLEQSVEKCFIR